MSSIFNYRTYRSTERLVFLGRHVSIEVPLGVLEHGLARQEALEFTSAQEEGLASFTSLALADIRLEAIA